MFTMLSFMNMPKHHKLRQSYCSLNENKKKEKRFLANNNLCHLKNVLATNQFVLFQTFLTLQQK